MVDKAYYTGGVMAKSDGIICQHCGREAIKPLELREPLSLLNIPIRLDDSVPPSVIRFENDRWEVVAAIDIKVNP